VPGGGFEAKSEAGGWARKARWIVKPVGTRGSECMCCEGACVHACMHACVRACVRACVLVRACQVDMSRWAESQEATVDLELTIGVISKP
jgi:hypothetical protein